VKREELFVKQISATEGPTLKRYTPRAYGRATMIRKRSSHVTVILGQQAPLAKKTIPSSTAAPAADTAQKNATKVKKPNAKNASAKPA
jgi:hypothetical protein